MRFIGLNMAQLQVVLNRFNNKHKTSVYLQDEKVGGIRKPYVQGVLRLHHTPDKYHRRGQARLDYYTMEHIGVPKRMPCVCWHGCRDFFRAVFTQYPTATIRTGKATYKGRDNFEATYQDTDVNIGSQIFPMQFSEACDCPENGSDWIGLGERIKHNRKVQRLVGKQAVNQ